MNISCSINYFNCNNQVHFGVSQDVLKSQDHPESREMPGPLVKSNHMPPVPKWPMPHADEFVMK